MVPAFWAAWQPTFLQYLQAQRQGLSDVLQQHSAHWRQAAGQAAGSEWSTELLDGIGAAGGFLPNMQRSSVGSFLWTLSDILFGVQLTASMQQLVQPMVEQWPGASRAFLAPLAYAFTEVSSSSHNHHGCAAVLAVLPTYSDCVLLFSITVC
jgi:hypothetical protein